ncbi:MAG: WYL domain-containing protein [Erysipelotrichaceae bacterium]|nr:WYL domain-containing protein [Erysipelotrichaceae bacterium]
MPKKENQKFKSLLVAKILIEETDDKHPLTTDDIIERISDIETDPPEYRSVLRDIHQLDEFFQIQEGNDNDFGYVIEKSDEYYNRGWKIIQRPFEYEDIQLLIEAINSSKGISHKKSNELKEKVASLRSIHEKEKLLDINVYTLGRTKTDTDILLLLGSINDAIEHNHKLSFVYKNYTFNDKGKIEKVSRRQGKEYIVSPYQILMSESNYYLLAYSSYFQNIIPYRIDRMEKTFEVEEEREGFEEYRKIDFNDFFKETFNMWIGDRMLVKLLFTNDLLYTVIDRFGKENIQRYDENHFTLYTKVMVSNQFYSWLAGFGSKVKVLEPKELAEEYKLFIKSIYDDINR